MGFRQRWGFIVLIVATFLLVFFSFDPDFARCKCKLKCPTSQTETCKCRVMPTESDPVRVWKDRLRSGHIQRPEFKKDGWVLDCITWNKKWELPTSEIDPHEFTLDEGLLKGAETTAERMQVFRDIFRKEYWPSKDPGYYGLQASGPGAVLKNSQGAVAALHVIISKMKTYLGKPTITILDLACGDLQWMNRFLVTRDDTEYTGVDIVPEIINSHKKQFENLPNSKFIHMDIVTAPINESYDLVIMRDVLQYLQQADAIRALNHISSSGSKFLLATTFPDTTQNGDITKIPLKDRKCPYNLELPPFLLEPPICTSYDWNVEHLGLWSLPIRQKYEY